MGMENSDQIDAPDGAGGSAFAQLIADAVHDAIVTAYPDKYAGLCHAYAVIGANLTALVTGREYRPVAGLAIFDGGDGSFVMCLDNAAFSRLNGGSFHCWIQSSAADPAQIELIDYSYRNNEEYARKHGLPWNRARVNFLWGLHAGINVGGEPFPLPRAYEEGKAWYRETDEGFRWLLQRLHEHMDVYAKLTSLAIQNLRQAQTDIRACSPQCRSRSGARIVAERSACANA